MPICRAAGSYSPGGWRFGSGDGGVLLVKPAAQREVGLGVKLVSVFPQNVAAGRPLIHGLVALFDPLSGVPTALLDGGFLTAWRTGAASGAATDLLARPTPGWRR